ncbi:MAG: ABC transporter permease [Fibrobacter sp.]|nr:ABC transporter permease [Fibrobacter sp.]
MTVLLTPFKYIARLIAEGIMAVGEIAWLLIQIIKRVPLVRKNPELTIRQMVNIGVSSIPLLFITSLFTGAVAAVQSEYQFRGLIPDKFIGTAVAKMVLIELGPILTALVLAGRVGSALAAEIGSMREKEELAAYEVLNLDPLRYLAMPRFLTFLIMVPCLTIMSSFLAIIGGWIVCLVGLDITTYTYFTGVQYLFENMDLFSGLIKSVVFGIIIFSLGYYHGLNAGAGAKGVGQATMKTVVSACVSLLVFDLFIALLMFS